MNGLNINVSLIKLFTYLPTSIFDYARIQTVLRNANASTAILLNSIFSIKQMFCGNCQSQMLKEISPESTKPFV